MTLLTKQDLMTRWQVCSKTVERLARRFGLPKRVYTVRTIRYALEDVVAVDRQARAWLKLSRQTAGLSQTVSEVAAVKLAQFAHERRAKARQQHRAGHRNGFTPAEAGSPAGSSQAARSRYRGSRQGD